ncbi:MAG TPA: phosphotransferase [Acidimicrobiales bacterium]|nr:phosphotransferase [Acidimicrobiales bacterium]
MATTPADPLDVAEVLAERCRRGLTAMELACFGTERPEEIIDLVSAFVGSPNGWEPRVILYSVSIGVVVGLELEDGEKVVVTAFPPYHDAGFLEAADGVRRRLLAGGYPAPAPRGGVRRLGKGLGWVEDWLEAPAAQPPASVVVPLARELARLVELCRQVQPSDALRRSWQSFEGAVGIWRRPLRPGMDPYGVPGKAWVEAIARAGRADAEACPGPELVGHVDWRPDNVRFAPDKGLAAVYDWDSIQLTHLVHLLAGACTGLRPDGMAAFLQAHDEATGTALARPARLAVAGRVVWSHAIWARYEEVEGRRSDDQRFLPRLVEDARAYRAAAVA